MYPVQLTKAPSIKHTLSALILMVVALLSTGCSEKQVAVTELPEGAVILAFGDSLTYGTGANSQTESYPAILQSLTNLSVINAGIPGELSAQGLKRLPGILQSLKPDMVILCHGGNDLIRKMGRVQLKQNLEHMVQLIQASGATAIMVGVPSFNLTLDVPALYSEVAAQYGVPLQLDILPTIEGNPSKKSDQIHPNAEGYKELAEAIYALMHASGAIK
jgi:lysophospholipase L1-like esterase